MLQVEIGDLAALNGTVSGTALAEKAAASITGSATTCMPSAHPRDVLYHSLCRDAFSYAMFVLPQTRRLISWGSLRTRNPRLGRCFLNRDVFWDLQRCQASLLVLHG